jgi:glutathione synthase/RimK-type ligase-like ATP-grasp enzyme
MASVSVLSSGESAGKCVHDTLEDLGIDSQMIDIAVENPPESDGYIYFSDSCENFRQTDKMLRLIGPMFNSLDALNDTGNKALQYEMLKKYDVPTPQSYFGRDLSSVVLAINKIPDNKFVMKPALGSFGIGVNIMEKEEALDVENVKWLLWEYREVYDPPFELICVQEHIPSDGVKKAMVVGERCFPAAYIPNYKNLEHTYVIGLKPGEIYTDIIQLTEYERGFLQKIGRASGLDFFSVDILDHPEKGSMVIDINNLPFPGSWGYIENEFGLNYSDTLAKHVMNKLEF